MITRRSLALASVALLPLGLAACPGQTPSTLAADASLVAQGIAAVATALQAQGVAIAGQVAGYASQAAALAQQIAAATAGAPTGTVQQIVSLIGTVATAVLAVIPGTSSLVGLVNDLESLAPALLAAIGSLSAAAQKPGLVDPATARADLRRRLGLAG